MVQAITCILCPYLAGDSNPHVTQTAGLKPAAFPNFASEAYSLRTLGGIRTPGLLLRKQALYSTGLQGLTVPRVPGGIRTHASRIGAGYSIP